MPIRLPKLILSIGLCLGAGIAGSFFTISSIPTWYATLNKPILSPPNWVFGPVWTTLYIMMGVALYLVWTSKSKVKQNALNLFFVQLGLNALWSIIFFGLHSPFLALLAIVALWLLIVLTMRAFFGINKTSGWLLVPYLAWVSFATYLNYSIWALNR
ncbi:MAG: tryptophan-rich sensory protein [Candidatus Levybacteria bacterium]|nr:tryptophan-rich sensory protein [Candidatus Levybacteria bacterium]